MESKKINQLATELTPVLSDLTIIGDPSTGISKKITLSQMASLFTGTVEEYPNLASFPLVGTADTIYIALDTNVLYRWDTGLTSYVELSPNIINSLVFSDANGFDGNISLVGSVATLTITTALTTGSVPFIGASGALSQDNANLFFDDTNNRLGINTNAPTTALDVFGSGIIGRLNGTSTNNAFLGFASAGSNKWSIGNVQSDHRFRIYNEETTSELVSVLQTGEFGIGIANPTTKLHIDGGASALIANLDANISVAKSISFRSDNSNRINLEVSGTESGSNAGANFFIRTYTDAGALLATPITITRSTGAISLTTALSGTTANFSGNVGINVNLSSWDTSFKALQIMGGFAAMGNASAGYIFGNAYFDGDSKYYSTAPSARLDIGNGMVFRVAGSGTAGTVIPYVAALTLASNQAATFSSSVTANSFTTPSTGGAGSTTWSLLHDQTTAGDFGIYNPSGAKIYINASGNIGLGMTNPTALLHLQSSAAGGQNIRIQTSLAAGRNYMQFANGSGDMGYIGYGGGDNKFYINNQLNDDMLIFTNSLLRIDITSLGRVLIGGHTSSIYPARLSVRQTTGDPTAEFISAWAGDQSTGAVFISKFDNINTTSQIFVKFVIDNANVANGQINANGASQVAFGSWSDRRLKENITELPSQLSNILALKPCEFDYKNGSGHQIGFIAQEMQEVFPDSVGETEEGYLTVTGWNKTEAILVKAIQELKAELDILKAK